MPEDFHDFFSDDDSWDDGSGHDHLGSDGVDGGSSPLPPRPPKSRRDMRRHRKRKHRKRLIVIIASLVVIAMCIGIGVFAYGKVKQWRHNNLTDSSVVDDYPGPGDGDVAFTVESGQGVAEIAEGLHAKDIIKSVDAFTGVVASNSYTLYPGTYELKYHMKASAVAKILSDEGNAKGFVEVRQGERLDDVLKTAATSSGLPLKDFEDYVNDAAKMNEILPASANGKIEGWLEPGVYNIGDNPTPRSILEQLVQSRIENLNELGVPEGEERERILIIASIVEAEVNSQEYYGKVSRVIENRLKDGMPLGMDSTVAYGFKVKGTELTNDQLNDGSNPFNTRVNKGLPPTPISNPGDDAIQAAMHPEDGDWLYFVTTDLKTGETKFTSSYDEFEKFVQEYKNGNENAN